MAQQQVMGKGRRLELMTIFWARSTEGDVHTEAAWLIHSAHNRPHLGAPFAWTWTK